MVAIATLRALGHLIPLEIMCVQGGSGLLYGFIISDSSSAVDLPLEVCLRESSSPVLLYPGPLPGELLTCYSLTFSLVVECTHPSPAVILYKHVF